MVQLISKKDLVTFIKSRKCSEKPETLEELHSLREDSANINSSFKIQTEWESNEWEDNYKILRIKTTWNFLNCCRHSNPYWILINPPLPAKQTQQLQCVSRGVSRRTTATCYRTDPVSSAEVHRLSEVVALVKPRVIGPRERHNKLASTLIGPVHLNISQKQDMKAKENNKKGRHFTSQFQKRFLNLTMINY